MTFVLVGLDLFSGISSFSSARSVCTEGFIGLANNGMPNYVNYIIRNLMALKGLVI